jgi:hypothetical protein
MLQMVTLETYIPEATGSKLGQAATVTIKLLWFFQQLR